MALFEFNNSAGAYPLAGLVDDNGTLYGTASQGGGHSHGAVFKIDPRGEHVLHSFLGGSDGAYPTAELNDFKGILYGVTSMGGNASCYTRGCGTVFAVTTSGKETVLHTFIGGADGAHPQARLTVVKGVLYGTTVNGGAYNDGTVFKITTNGRETVLHTFRGGTDGAHPEGRLTNVRGMLYGTTYDGGKYNQGTVFKITTSAMETSLYSFGAYPYDAANPAAGLTYFNGTLYGTTARGGAFCYYLTACGTVFAITEAGSERVIYNFLEGDDGAVPLAALTAINGVLYGTTYDGPVEGSPLSFGCGSVFEITPSGQLTVLSSLGGIYGCHSTAALTRFGNDIVGTASKGGTYSRGTAFEITP